MAIAEPQSVGDAMWNLNAKATTDAGVQLLMGAAQDVKLSQARLAILGENLLARAATNLAQPDPMEAAAAKQILTGDAKVDNALVAGLAQIFAKAAQTTPPVTGYGPVTTGGGGSGT
jgi:hypothetical protein